jgi:putative hydrolases of HD superfamily
VERDTAQAAEDTVIDDRLAGQIAFIVEIDKLKSVYRRTLLIDRSRSDNSAEHSWHLAIMTMMLSEYAAEPIDVCRTMRMVLTHDLVEVYAGDTFVYDSEANKDKAAREQAAADRIFGMLPDDQAKEFRALWDEFEERRTPEARFGAAVDRLQPLLSNYHTEGHAWRSHGIKYAAVIERNRHIAEGAPKLWEYVKGLIDDAVAKGYLEK